MCYHSHSKQAEFALGNRNGVQHAVISCRPAARRTHPLSQADAALCCTGPNSSLPQSFCIHERSALVLLCFCPYGTRISCPAAFLIIFTSRHSCFLKRSLKTTPHAWDDRQVLGGADAEYE